MTDGNFWTEEMVAIAAGLKRAGFSNDKIAERLGISKNSVRRKMETIKAKRRLDGHGGNRGCYSVGPIVLEIYDAATIGIGHD